MKKNLFLLVFLLSAVLISAQTGEISITINDIIVKKAGNINIGVFKKDGFPSFGSQIAYKILEVSDSECSVLIKDIAPGTYAVAVFQDINSDKALSTNLFGAPTEPYGFSKNKFGRGGPPDFNDVSFKLDSGKRIILVIHLK